MEYELTKSESELVFKVARRVSELEVSLPNRDIHFINALSGTDVNVETKDVYEGTNLFYTDLRVDGAVDSVTGIQNGIAGLDMTGNIPKTQLPNAGGYVEHTYSELMGMVTGKTLVPNTYYRMTDFQTIHRICNTTVLNTSVVLEPLILHAVNNETFDKQAFSAAHPKDIIFYQIVDTMVAVEFGIDGFVYTSKGRIFYRKDTMRNIEAPYDWRNVLFRRWSNSEYGGKYVFTDDTGGSHQTFVTFNGDAQNVVLCGYHSDITERQLNTVFMSTCNNVYLGPQSDTTTFYYPVTNFRANENFNSVKCMIRMNNVRVEYAMNSVLGDGITEYVWDGVTIDSSMEMKVNLTNVSIGTGNTSMNILQDLENVHISDGLLGGNNINMKLLNCVHFSKYAGQIEDANTPVGTNIVFGNHQTNYVTLSNTTTYQVKLGETVIGVVSTAPVTITLPSNDVLPESTMIIIKDESYNASTFPITIQGYSGQVINESGDPIQITTNGGSVKGISSGNGDTYWCVIP